MQPTLDDFRTVLRCVGHEELFDVVIHLSGGSADYFRPDGRRGLLALPKKVWADRRLSAKKWKEQLLIGSGMIEEVGLAAYLSPLSETDRRFIDQNY
jgi:hypothetical protein